MSDSKTERLFPPLPKDHPIYKRGYIIGGRMFGGHQESQNTDKDDGTKATDSSDQEPGNAEGET